MTEKPTVNEEILMRVDLVVRLLIPLAKTAGERLGPTEQIVFLGDLGLSNAQIAKVVGRASNYVSSVLSRSKKRKQ